MLGGGICMESIGIGGSPVRFRGSTRRGHVYVDRAAAHRAYHVERRRSILAEVLRIAVDGALVRAEDLRRR